MDRFIDEQLIIHILLCEHLKSSMDRFIDAADNCGADWNEHLKSSMDRFIVYSLYNL